MDQTLNGGSGASQPQNPQNQEFNSPNFAGGASNPTGGNMIPRERLNEVIQQREQERQAREAAEARLRQLEQAPYQPNTSVPNDSAAEVAYVRTKYGIPDEARIREEARQEAIRAAEEAARRIAQEEVERKQRDNQLMDQVTQLEKEFDGSDGVIPKFDRDEVLHWGAQHQIFNPRVAFEEMHKDQFKAKYAKEYKEVDKPTYAETPSQASTATMQPITAQEFAQLSIEEMDKRLGYAQ